LHGSETTLLAWSVDPGEVGEMAVNRATNNLAANLLELRIGIAEGNDLRGADKGEVQWVEEQHEILAL
jgi:hypothetical protein